MPAPPPSYPEEADYLLVQALNKGDLDGAVKFFEADALYVTPGGSHAKGTDAIRQSLETMLAGTPTLSSEVVRGMQGNDIALVVYRWTLTSQDGEVIRSGTGADCLRRQDDGRWFFAVRDPEALSAV